MKDTNKVAELIAALKNEVETPYELAAIERLEKELIEGAPKVEVIDENYQKFLGLAFKKRPGGHYVYHLGLQQAIWIYHFGEMPAGYEIHHKNEIKSDNTIENLQALTKHDHMSYHRSKEEKVTMKCKNCGKTFEGYTYRRSAYCSQKCKNDWHHKETRENRTCVICGKKFTASKYDITKCCSNHCGQIMRNAKKLERKSCPVCGKIFEVMPSKDKKFCSIKCSQEFIHQKCQEVRNCVICGKEFTIGRWKKNKCCSRHCAVMLAHRNHNSIHKNDTP